MTSGKTGEGGDKRLAAVKRVLRQAAEHINADFGIRLWDGEVIPLGADARTDLLVALNSPAVLSRLIRQPRLTTVVDLVASGDVDIIGGTLLDLAARRGSGTKGIWKKIGKLSLARALWPFLFSAKADAAANPLKSEAYQGEQIDKDAGGRDNKALVQFHYDLSNTFYQLFLDPEMQYSCAYFPTWESSLEDAQRAKLDMICRKLRLQPGERFLDIGCGWGGLVCHAAQHYGVEAHGVTLSEAQLAFTKEKIARLGLEGRVHVELRDYRDISGTFDKIASIGMFEHVGLDNHAAYFNKLRELLKPRGILLNHAITRPAKKDARAFRRKRPEYQAIVNYIFPGSELDHIGGSVTSLERHGFEIHDVEAWREHYALTTRRWCERLYAEREAAVREVGEAKTRLWLLYLAGVSLGFERGTIGIFQTVATRRARGLSGLPPTRADLYAGADVTGQR
ncbi:MULTISPECIES: cyclopropane-fatty-acyl-phospholipid synthase family protein [unclassified Chelatococcus]|jgi:cyclopropane-fatty-acyl-phospholipid synthase|uniref:SAM-dependent methyltransferase n=1 Tax=unclassified Chelatococcus TaxID=2638111 RepID=UPI001BCC56FB|nr:MULTISPECIES: cyclopropane-fatty-acyl-phospholipid synthase family protein [unclassified Chelatococcus]CAH1657631.1 Cyclopropane-fatty-acyl-phospholipid synthase [Hyphomicrobiales bacterium]MBS7740706.1 class I SAM-dependent methyltransferase [Chelatococcus sp. HY11]MBX3546060.1 class I SAM-dependent methyltransferase [Chelatococcus sp.]MCO5079809.1 cyclopropane-fatty-acyl-phospholipid synthase family protein [Chelatococcus sp.]CAH1684370.1 Cyclopropane-fatty-acyl-phospholipid synthase [Hyp